MKSPMIMVENECARRMKSFKYIERREVRVPNRRVLNGDNVRDWVTGLEAIEEGEKYRPPGKRVVLDYEER